MSTTRIYRCLLQSLSRYWWSSTGYRIVSAGSQLVAMLSCLLHVYIAVCSSALVAIGGVLLGIGLFLLVLSLFLCCHAYCIWYVRDAETQTVVSIKLLQLLVMNIHSSLLIVKNNNNNKN